LGLSKYHDSLTIVYLLNIHTPYFLTSLLVFCSGCVPPEYVKRGVYSRKYDVYSFGVLLLQILGGKKNSCEYGIENDLNLLEYVSSFLPLVGNEEENFCAYI